MTITLEHAALISVCVVAVSSLTDFLIGKKGRKKVCEILIFKSWYSLELLDLNGFIKISANFFNRFLRLIFGEEYLGWQAFLIHIPIVILASVISKYCDLPSLIFNHLGYTVNIAERTSDYIPPDHGGAIFLGYPFAFLSYLITRYLVEEISGSTTLLKSISFWIFDILSTTIVALTCFTITGLLLGWGTPYMVNLFITELDLKFSLLAPVFSIVTLIPTLVHFILFVLSIVVLCLEATRRLAVLILERIDESQKSPLAILSLVAGTIGTLIVAIIRLNG